MKTCVVGAAMMLAVGSVTMGAQQAAPAPSVPIVLTATQAAAASSSNGRRPGRNKDFIVSPDRSEAG